MNIHTTSNKNTDTNCCLCPNFERFGGYIQRSTWNDVTELVDHMDNCGHWLRAVVGSETQWAVRLSENRPAQQTNGPVRDLLVNNNRWTVVLDQCPAGPVRDSLTALLLMASVRYRLGDLASNILERETISDSLLMEAILFAAHLQDRCTFLQLIRACAKNRCVFKQKFVHQHCRENLQSACAGGEGGRWVYRALYEGGEKDLALFVAANHPHEKSLIAEFCQDEVDDFDLRQDKFKLALRKLYEESSNHYKDFVSHLYQSPGSSVSDQSFLIRQALRLKEYDLFITLCNFDFLQKDLKFCASFLLSGEDADSEAFSQICEKLDLVQRKRLRLCAVKFTLTQYFLLKSDASLKMFIEQFPYHNSVDASPIICCLLQKAIRKCVEEDSVDCFIQLCVKYFGFENQFWHRDVIACNQDFKSACESAIDARPKFIVKLLEYLAEKKIVFACQLLTDALSLSFLLNTVLEQKAWNVVPVLLSDVSRYFYNGFKLLGKCLRLMLSDKTVWSGLGRVLDQWLSEYSLTSGKSDVCCLQKCLFEDCWLFSVSSLTRYCEENGYPNLAVFLAVVSGDWGMTETLVTAHISLELHPGTLWVVVDLAVEKGLYSLGIAMLKMYRMNADVVRLCEEFPGSNQLVTICEDQGLFDWALVLKRENLTYLREHRMLCPNHAVWDWIVNSWIVNSWIVNSAATPSCPWSLRWDIVMEFMTVCTDSKILNNALKTAVNFFAPVDVIEALVGRVDLTECAEINAKDEKRTLLHLAVCKLITLRGPVEKQVLDTVMKTIRLCLASGLSTFQRSIPKGSHNCPLSLVLSSDVISHKNIFAKLMIDCGAISYKTLHEIADDVELQDYFEAGASMNWKEAFHSVQEAAGTPCRLEHLARLAVSHSIGCHPGRSERINSLPLPSSLKNKVNFKDVLKEEQEVNSEEMEYD